MNMYLNLSLCNIIVQRYFFEKGLYMIGYVWSGMLVAAFVFGIFSGSGAEVGTAVMNSASDCVSFILKIGAFMIMWSGFMNIAEKSGITTKLSHIFSPIIRLVFSGVKKDSKEERLICSNITANMLGLSNAATPLGISAMKKLSEKSRDGIATDAMCMLAVINSASLQIVPSTLIALRETAGSINPGEITVPIWIASLITVTLAVFITKICERRAAYA